MASNDVFQNAIESVSHPVYHQTRAEVIEAYQDQYGDAGWRSQIISDLVAQTGKSRATVSREFQYDKRLGMERYKSEHVTKATSAKYEQLGQALGPIRRELNPGQDSITITVKGEQSNGRGGIRDRAITVTLSGSNAHDWVNNPNFGDIWDEYGFDFDEAEDGEYALDNVSVSAG